MIIKVAVADNDDEYIERLSYGLEKYKDLYISVYTDKRSIEQALQTKKFDILLFSPSVYNGQVSLPKSTLGLMLYDEEVSVPEECRNFNSIKKYQRISGIYKKILEQYADICQSFSVSGNNKTIGVAVYSPIGGSGKTTIACALATYLAMRGKRTLYLNFEELGSDGCYFPQTGDNGMSELISQLGKDINFTVKLQGIQQTKMEKLYYINDFESPNDIYEITDEEIEELLSQVINSGLYDFVIVDTGVSMNRKAMKLFECLDKIVLVDKQDAISRLKMDKFMSQVHIVNEYSYKMLRTVNFANGNPSVTDERIQFADAIRSVPNQESDRVISVIAERYMSRLGELVAN